MHCAHNCNAPSSNMYLMQRHHYMQTSLEVQQLHYCFLGRLRSNLWEWQYPPCGWCFMGCFAASDIIDTTWSGSKESELSGKPLSIKAKWRDEWNPQACNASSTVEGCILFSLYIPPATNANRSPLYSAPGSQFPASPLYWPWTIKVSK
jgi:hypothetical protein